MQNDSLRARGVHFVSLLMDGIPPGTPATRKNLDDWIEAPPIAHTCVLDNIGSGDAGSGDSFVAWYMNLQRDQYLIYDLRTMTLVKLIAGDVTAALAYLASLVGNDAGP